MDATPGWNAYHTRPDPEPALEDGLPWLAKEADHMGSVAIRNLPDGVVAEIKAAAVHHGRSLESELD